MNKMRLRNNLVALYQEYYAAAISYALILTHLPDVALNAVQEAFLSAAVLPELSRDPLWVFNELNRMSPYEAGAYTVAADVNKEYLPPELQVMNLQAQPLLQSIKEFLPPELQVKDVHRKQELNPELLADRERNMELLYQWFRRTSEREQLTGIIFAFLDTQNSMASLGEKQLRGIGGALDLSLEETQIHLQAYYRFRSEQIETKAPMLLALLNLLPECYRLPSPEEQINQLLQKAERIYSPAYIARKWLLRGVKTVAILLFALSFFHPDLGLMPWQWEALLQFSPRYPQEYLSSVAVVKTEILTPWEIRFVCHDENSDEIIIRQKKTDRIEPYESWVIIQGIVFYDGYINVTSKTDSVTRLYTYWNPENQRRFARYYDNSQKLFMRIDGSESDEELLRIVEEISG